MFRIKDTTTINNELWLLIERDSFWVIQRNSIGHPRHMGNSKYISRVWRKQYKTKDIS